MTIQGYDPQDLVDLYMVARNVAWRYRLDLYEDEVLRGVMKTLAKAENEVKKNLERYMVSQAQDERGQALLAEFDRLTLGIRQTLVDQTLEASSEAGHYATLEHNDILSFGAKVTPFNNVALSPSQFRAFFATVPLGGKLLTEWVDSAFDSTVRQGMLEELQAGVLQGEGYPALVKRLTSDFELTKREAITIARTYVQSANVEAQEAVYAANADIVPKVRWTATLENSYKGSGRGVCLTCAARDGKEYPREGPKPAMPAHPRCKCVYTAITVHWKDLGIDLPELENLTRPYTLRPDKNIDTGGKRTIIEAGQHQGDYGTFFDKQSKTFQLNAVGPGRYELLKSGTIEWQDLLNSKGDVRTLRELRSLKK